MRLDDRAFMARPMLMPCAFRMERLKKLLDVLWVKARSNITNWKG